MKKLLAMVLVLVMILSMTACSGSSGKARDDEDQGSEPDTKIVIPEFVAEDYDRVGTCGEDAQWGYVQETGELVIIGTGTMEGYIYDYDAEKTNAPWSEWPIQSVSIYGVTNVGSNAFKNCASLTSVNLGDGVMTIESWAFNDCDSLTSIELPDSVTTIGFRAFSDCDSLTEIKADGPSYVDAGGVLFTKDKKTLVQYPGGKSADIYLVPDSVTTIGDYAFYYCDGLTSVDIPDSVTTIGERAFCYCDRLTSVEISDSVTTIGDYAFYWCKKLTDVYYAGTEAQWNDIDLGDDVFYLTYATIHYES